MSTKVREFRGLIYSKYDSEAEFAKSLNWTKQRLSKITNGIKQPDLKEIDQFSNQLEIPPERLMRIFLDHASPDGPQDSARGA